MSKFKVGDKVEYVNDFSGIEKGSLGTVEIIEDEYEDGGQELLVNFPEKQWTVQGSELGLVEDTFVKVSQKIVATAIKSFDTPPREEPKKYNTDKPMMSLIRPEFQLALAEALTYGYTKYDEQRGDIQNYLKGDGFHYSTIYDSLQRHLNAFISGENIDPESGLEHLALASANLMFLHTYENSDKGIDDRTVLKKD